MSSSIRSRNTSMRTDELVEALVRADVLPPDKSDGKSASRAQALSG
jgi:hypothetical protein